VAATQIAHRNAVQDTIAILLERRSIALPSRDDQIKALHGLKGAPGSISVWIKSF
jgi:hypothetical protein